MPADDKTKLHNIEGCEIFATGKWHGDEYTIEDLDAMCEAFSKVGFKPPLKLGHSEKQHLLSNAGLPAAGWVERVYRKGEKLLADFSSIPKQIHDLIQRKAYDRVSAEIYWDYSHGESKLPRVLKAVALLGSEIPEVTTLESISALYYDDTGHSYKVVEMESGKMPKAVIGRLKGEKDTTVQTLVFPKEVFTEAEAVKWAKGHDFKADKVDETEDSYRLRQREPGDFQSGSFRTISMGDKKVKESRDMMYTVATGSCSSLGGEDCHCLICPMSCSCMSLQTGGGGCSMMGSVACICSACPHIEDRIIGTGGKEEHMSNKPEDEKKNAAPEKKAEEIAVFQKEVAEKMEAFEKKNQELAAALAKEKALRREEQVDAKIKEFTKQMKVSPAQAPFLKALYLAVPQSPVIVKFDKEEKSINGDKAIDELMALQPVFANFTEQTMKGIDQNDIDTRIREYCKENNLNFHGEGYVTAMKALDIKEV